jgi:hypothetical protein
MRWRTARGLAALALVSFIAASCDESQVASPTTTLSSRGGTVDVQCIGRDRIKVVGTTPAPGYTAKVIVAGPTHQASLRFSSPTANDFKVFLDCVDARPALQELEIEDTTLAP